MLRIKYPPCETEIVCHDLPGGRPPLRSRSMNFVSLDRADLFEDGLEVRALVGTERAGDILPDDIPWISAISCIPHFLYDPDGFIEKAGAGAVQSFPPARNAHVLARAAEGDDVYRLNLPAVHPGDIAVMLHKRQPLCGHPDWERLNLRSPHGGNAGKQAPQGETAGAVKQAAKGQFIHLVPPPLLQGRSTSSFLRFSPQKYPPAGCRSPRPCGG